VTRLGLDYAILVINALEENLTNDSIPNSEFLSEGQQPSGTSGFSDGNSELRIKYWSDPLLTRVDESSNPRLRMLRSGRRVRFHLAQVLDLAFKVSAKDHHVAPARPPRAA